MAFVIKCIYMGIVSLLCLVTSDTRIKDFEVGHDNYIRV